MQQSAFRPLKGTVIIKSGGVFREAKLFAHADTVYAKVGSGFIRIQEHGATSKEKTSWAGMNLDKYVGFKMGHMVLLPEMIEQFSDRE